MERGVKTLMDLSGRRALITGGAGHLGQVMAAALMECGAEVLIADLTTERAREAAERLMAEQGGRARWVGGDLEQPEGTDDMVRFVEREWGRLDILVNNAAFVGTSSLTGWNVPFDEQSYESWCRAVQVNLNSVFQVTRRMKPFLMRSEAASVINILSIYGICGPDLRLYEGLAMNNPAAYGAGKAGLLQFTRYCASCFAPAIRVNAITPGGIFRNQDPRFVERYADRTPMRRMAKEEDFKGAIVYLASDLSAYVTGQNLVVDGGWTVW